jgi:hypothetical protein
MKASRWSRLEVRERSHPLWHLLTDQMSATAVVCFTHTLSTHTSFTPEETLHGIHTSVGLFPYTSEQINAAQLLESANLMVYRGRYVVESLGVPSTYHGVLYKAGQKGVQSSIWRCCHRMFCFGQEMAIVNLAPCQNIVMLLQAGPPVDTSTDLSLRNAPEP